jgi:hypothetical protein
VRIQETRQLRSLVCALAVFACDPGYRLTPVGWTAAPKHEWERQFNGFTIRTRSLGGLIGDWWLYPRFEVLGNQEVVTVRSARLHTSSGEYPAAIDERVRHIPSGGGAFVLEWRFDEQHRTPDVLGKRAMIAVDLLVGSDPQILQVHYEKAACC